MRGTCPHAPHESAFLLVTNVRAEPNHQWIGAMQCQGCAKYILAIVQWIPHTSQAIYREHYPLGKPDDSVAPEIPEHIKPDFKEALRCLWVDAYNATAEMCRRAVEASCIDLGAPDKGGLEDKIDWLEAQRKITPFLKDVAHKIRLGGNRAAHPGAPSSPTSAPAGTAVAVPTESISTITLEHAKAIIQFSKEFFHHVYVVPKQLDKYDFSKPKPTK